MNSTISGLNLGTASTHPASDFYLSTNPSAYIAAADAPVQSVAGHTGAVTLGVADVSGAAALASPAFTGTPTINGVAIPAASREHLSYQPGLLTSVSNTKSVFYNFGYSATVDSIAGSANLLSCVSNPTVTLYECGTDASCAAPTTIGAVTVTAAGTAFTGTVSSAAIGSGHWVAAAVSAGTCTSIDVSATAQVHSN